MKTLFISDTHFGHQNIIKYENRPFDNIDEMDKELINRWNKIVNNNDIVWFLGDLSCGRNKEYMANVMKQLKGHKRMIMGNHDQWSIQTYFNLGFEYVSKYPIILKNHFILSHSPMPNIQDTDNFFYIYGHVHSSINYYTHTANSQCVCVERQNYQPIEIEEFNMW